MMEIWRDIPDYEGRYQVSDMGRVRGMTCVLQAQVVNSGYLVVHLHLDGARRARTVHRLVAQMFLPPDALRPEVNHKNTNKTDNKATNLEWVTRPENVAHARDNGLLRPSRHAVVGVSLLDFSEVIFVSQRHAECALSGTGKQSSAVHHCLIGKKQSAYGYTWRRA